MRAIAGDGLGTAPVASWEDAARRPLVALPLHAPSWDDAESLFLRISDFLLARMEALKGSVDEQQRLGSAGLSGLRVLLAAHLRDHRRRAAAAAASGTHCGAAADEMDALPLFRAAACILYNDEYSGDSTPTIIPAAALITDILDAAASGDDDRRPLIRIGPAALSAGRAVGDDGAHDALMFAVFGIDIRMSHVPSILANKANQPRSAFLPADDANNALCRMTTALARANW